MIASYRLQLQPDFGFAEAEALLPYLQRLGISHLYLSPITEAREGSMHGYDVVDHNEVRAAYGGREGLDQLLAAATEHELEIILDWVPNHAGVGPGNVAWQDVLAHGPYSPHADTFDIDWYPLKPELSGKVHLPFLGSSYGEALDGDELGLDYEDGRFYATYYDNRFALSPATYDAILDTALSRYERTEPYWDLKELAEAFAGLKPEERSKAEALGLRLAALDDVDPADWTDALDREALHALFEQQWWRLSHWRTAGYEINYRRFFDINELVGLRMEDDEVFWEAHRLLGELLAHEAVAGVRIDHIDGLFDPHDYLDKLRELGAQHVWVEKILAHGETLPEAWPVDGATGYGFMNDVMHLLLRPYAEIPLDRAWRRFAPEARPWLREVHRSKVLVMETSLSSELFRLAYELDRISEADYHTRDFTLEALREALQETVAAVNRYRTYLPDHGEEDEAREVIERAIHRAKSHNPATESTVYDFIARVVLGDVREDLKKRQRAWVGRFQQYTAPVAAKGVEDTAFYRHHRLTALNEVGGEPDEFSLPRQAFHAHNRFRALQYPRALIATATHDHKRGEDTRMRLLGLAEDPEAWDETLAALDAIGDDHSGDHGPIPTHAYLFLQTLAALWHGADHDTLADRLWQYLQKAARESKLETSWINPNETYEAEFEAFVRGVCADKRTPDALGEFAANLARLGFFHTITQTVLKLTAPGVPDFYQGTELLDLSLVDPDNRRPVDYDRRAALLDEFDGLLDAPEADAIRGLIDEQDERVKLYLTARLLRLRHAAPDLFDGGYRALEVEGDGSEYWIAFARETDGGEADADDALVVLVPRFPATFADAAPATVPLPNEWSRWRWTDWLTGTEVGPTEALDAGATPLPWAVLRRAT